jgi:hypothetical protein
VSDRRKGERRSGEDRRVRTIENFEEVVAIYVKRLFIIEALSAARCTRQYDRRKPNAE